MKSYEEIGEEAEGIFKNKQYVDRSAIFEIILELLNERINDNEQLINEINEFCVGKEFHNEHKK